MATKRSPVYRCIQALVRVCYPKIQVQGLENLPPEPAIIVGNHTKMNGPIACQLYLPGPRKIWCAGEMMQRWEVPAYAYRDFWSKKPRWCRWFYKILSYLITPLSVCIFNNADTIGVYHDTRIMSTFRQTVQALQEGDNIVIFPEHDAPYNHILCQFQDHFIDVARLYYKRTGKALCFVPLYVAPKLKTMYLGKPIQFQPERPMAEERERICNALMEEITNIACGLPKHVVVPYNNVSRKHYVTNVPEEALSHAKAGR